jgi:hypothetical protein
LVEAVRSFRRPGDSPFHGPISLFSDVISISEAIHWRY